MNNLYTHYEEGKACFDSGKYDEAREIFEEFVKHRSDFADVYNYLGYIYYIHDERESAIKAYRKAVDLNPSYTEALMNFAVVLNDCGMSDEALKYMNQLKSVQYYEGVADSYCLGKLANMHAETARAYKSVFWYGEAIKQYQKALYLCPDFPDIRLEYAVALRDYGDMEKAVYEFDQVIVRKNDYAEAYVHQGIAFYKLGFIGFALESWKKGYEIDNKNKILATFLYLLEGAREVK